MTRLHKASYIKSIEATVRTESHGRLSDIRVPTHVVCGAEDRLTTPEMAREIASMIPGAELTIIPGAGHLVNIEKPAEFDAAVIGFILRRRGG
jgi:pimeloyl-ACP methyl ester carboxylesterase